MPLFSGWERISNLQRVQISKKVYLRSYKLRRMHRSSASAMEQIYESLQIAQARKEAVEQVNRVTTEQIRLDNGLGSTLELTETLLQVRKPFNYAGAVFGIYQQKLAMIWHVSKLPSLINFYNT